MGEVVETGEVGDGDGRARALSRVARADHVASRMDEGLVEVEGVEGGERVPRRARAGRVVDGNAAEVRRRRRRRARAAGPAYPDEHRVLAVEEAADIALETLREEGNARQVRAVASSRAGSSPRRGVRKRTRGMKNGTERADDRDATRRDAYLDAMQGDLRGVSLDAAVPGPGTRAEKALHRAGGVGSCGRWGLAVTFSRL